MVIDNGRQRCIGKPWQGLWQNTWMAKEVREVIQRPDAVGFRVVKRGIIVNELNKLT